MRQHVEAGRIPAMKLGPRTTLIERSDLDEFRSPRRGRPAVTVPKREPQSFCCYLFDNKRSASVRTHDLHAWLQSHPIGRLDEYVQLNSKRVVAHLESQGGGHLADEVENAWSDWQAYREVYAKAKKITLSKFDEQAERHKIRVAAHHADRELPGLR
jgi:hypothetical protein